MTRYCPLDVLASEAQEQGGPAIEVLQLSKSFPGARARALDGIDLTVPKGSIFGLLGPNGAGKTTLMSILAGLLRPSSGSALVFSHDVLRDRPRIKQVLGVVPQEPAVYPTLTARENLEYFGRMQGLRNGRLKDRVEACLALADMNEAADQPVEHFSGGFKRRLNLVIGLIHEPRLLILDEPTVAIDPHSRALIHQRLRELHDAGISILLSTHNIEEAERLCQGVAIMNRGRVLAHGSVSAMLETQRNNVIQIQLEDEAPTALADGLANLPGLLEVSVMGRCVMVTAEQPNLLLAPLTRIIHEQGANVRSMGFGVTSLEQIFLSLTQERAPSE